MLGKGSTDGIIGEVVTSEKKFCIKFSKPKTKFCLSFHYNGDSSYLFVNEKKIRNFKAGKKNSNFTTQFCLANISENFDYVESEEVSFKENVYHSSVEYNAIDKFKFLNINKYLMVKNNRKQRLDLLKKYLLDY